MSDIVPKLLILGGTTEARELCEAVSARGIAATVSLAGRVRDPVAMAVPQRVGGFGGASGMAEYLITHGITHLIDASHPFAAQISRNAIEASCTAGIPLAALTRPPWEKVAGDTWHEVATIAQAVAALEGPARRIMLAIGRQHLPDFADLTQHFYLLRVVETSENFAPFPHMHIIVGRGPFNETEDAALLRTHRIDMIVSKNSGGTGAYAKIAAARRLGIPVCMIARPALPARTEFRTFAEIWGWLGHIGTERGV